MKNYAKKSLKASNGITLIALVITIVVLLILAGISIAMLSGDNGILQRATDSKQTSEIAEAKEQAQMDIMAYIADKTANHEDTSLDDVKVKGILTGKSYVKVAGDTSFTTSKGEYEIPYSEIYNKLFIAESYGLRADGKFYCNPSSMTSEYNGSHWERTQSGLVYDSAHFTRFQGGLFVEEFDESESADNLFCVWDSEGDISLGEVIECDVFDENGNFLCTQYFD